MTIHSKSISNYLFLKELTPKNELLIPYSIKCDFVDIHKIFKILSNKNKIKKHLQEKYVKN